MLTNTFREPEQTQTNLFLGKMHHFIMLSKKKHLTKESVIYVNLKDSGSYSTASLCLSVVFLAYSILFELFLSKEKHTISLALLKPFNYHFHV